MVLTLGMSVLSTSCMMCVSFRNLLLAVALYDAISITGALDEMRCASSKEGWQVELVCPAGHQIAVGSVYYGRHLASEERCGANQSDGRNPFSSDVITPHVTDESRSVCNGHAGCRLSTSLQDEIEDRVLGERDPDDRQGQMHLFYITYQCVNVSGGPLFDLPASIYEGNENVYHSGSQVMLRSRNYPRMLANDDVIRCYIQQSSLATASLHIYDIARDGYVIIGSNCYHWGPSELCQPRWTPKIIIGTETLNITGSKIMDIRGRFWIGFQAVHGDLQLLCGRLDPGTGNASSGHLRILDNSSSSDDFFSGRQNMSIGMGDDGPAPVRTDDTSTSWEIVLITVTGAGLLVAACVICIIISRGIRGTRRKLKTKPLDVTTEETTSTPPASTTGNSYELLVFGDAGGAERDHVYFQIPAPPTDADNTADANNNDEPQHPEASSRDSTGYLIPVLKAGALDCPNAMADAHGTVASRAADDVAAESNATSLEANDATYTEPRHHATSEDGGPSFVNHGYLEIVENTAYGKTRGPARNDPQTNPTKAGQANHAYLQIIDPSAVNRNVPDVMVSDGELQNEADDEHRHNVYFEIADPGRHSYLKIVEDVSMVIKADVHRVDIDRSAVVPTLSVDSDGTRRSSDSDYGSMAGTPPDSPCSTLSTGTATVQQDKDIYMEIPLHDTSLHPDYLKIVDGKVGSRATSGVDKKYGSTASRDGVIYTIA